MSNAHTFELINLELGYGSSEALKIRNLKVPANALTFVVGKSGAGKTTLLEVLACTNDTLLNHHESKLVFNSKDGTSIDLKAAMKSRLYSLEEIRKRYFSFIFQKNNLFEDLTVWENLLIIVALRGAPLESYKAEVLSLFIKFGLNEAIFDRMISQLSEGQRQRVAFIRGLTQSFEVLFADEPTGNLDPVFSRLLMRHLREEIVQQKKSAVIVSHDIQLAIEYGDCIVLLGEDVANGATSTVAGFFNLIEQGVWQIEPGNNMSNDETVLFIKKLMINAQ